MGLTKVVYTMTTATCDKCGHKITLEDRPRRENLKLLKEFGWTYVKGEYPLKCHNCSGNPKVPL